LPNMDGIEVRWPERSLDYIAKSVQIALLMLNVFKFGEISDLIDPEYKYMLLARRA
jgi:hypothetical protein